MDNPHAVKVKSLSHVQLFVTPWTVVCTRLLYPWDLPGKSTGVGCHCLLCDFGLSEVPQSCLTLCDPSSSILVWEIPWTEEPGGLQSMESQKVGHDSD